MSNFLGIFVDIVEIVGNDVVYKIVFVVGGICVFILLCVVEGYWLIELFGYDQVDVIC